MIEKETIYDSSKELFEETASREKFKSSRLKELALDYARDMSVRDAAKRLNRIRHESDMNGVRVGISAQTYRNMVESEGAAIAADIEKKCDEILSYNGFALNGEIEESSEFKPEASEYLPIEVIGAAMAECNIKKAYVSDYESPEHTVNISADDVCVKKQTEMRPRGEEEHMLNGVQRKRVNNSVIHVESNGGKYILNNSSVFGALRLLIGFLLCGGLLKKQLVFFTDGAREIHGEISRMFAFANYKIKLERSSRLTGII